MVQRVSVTEHAEHLTTRCRLCRGSIEKQFELTVLGRHPTGYWRCSKCRSLQTDEPHWLADAYSESLTVSDVGAVRRCLTCRAVIWLILRLLRIRQARLLDFGGGSGLLCRLLRDIGIDAWTFDIYGSGEYARLFRVDAGAVAPGSFEIVTAFEVFEHLPYPDDDLTKLFHLSPEIMIASTEPYRIEYDKNWWYLSPNTGQHVFFYSQSALQLIADRFGYSLQSVGGWHIFTRRPIKPAIRSVLGRVLSGPSLQLCRVIMEAIPNQRHITRDYQLSLESTESSDTISVRNRPDISK
jgi:Methyltransferase domain